MVSPKISVIIVNYNGKQLLEKCLESLLKIDYNSIEIIVVDNNSTDDSVEFLSKNYHSITLLKLDSNKGFAEPNNIAARMAKGDFLLFLNNDTIVTPTFLSELVHVMKDEKIGICQSLLLKPDGKIDSSGDFVDQLGIVYNSKKHIDHVREIFSARGASMMIRKSLFEKLGGFDEKFYFSFEDVDLSWRARILDYSVVVVPKSIVYHYGGKSSKEIKNELTFHGTKNQLSMKLTNFEFPLSIKKLFSFFVIYGIREIKISLDYLFFGKTNMKATKYEDKTALKPNFIMILKGIFWLIRNSNYLLKKYQKINSHRIIRTKQLEKMKLISNHKQ